MQKPTGRQPAAVMPLKTTVIALEPHDDVISIRERLSWAKTPRIVLLWPGHARLRLSALDLRLLSRRAEALGARVGLVTRLSYARREAAAVGMPVFSSTGAAQRQSWGVIMTPPRPGARPPRRNLRALRLESRTDESHWKDSQVVRVAAFAAGVGAVLAVALVLLPRAEIRIFPEQQVQEFVLSVRGDPGSQQGTHAGRMALQRVTTDVSADGRIDVRGQVLIPVTRASGTVRVTNLTDAVVTLPRGTIVFALLDEPVRFVTLRDGQLDPQTTRTIDVPVEAVLPGRAGNLDAGEINRTEGSVGFAVQVANPAATSGGADRLVVGPNQDDRARLRNEVLEQGTALAADAMAAVIGPDGVLVPDTIVAGAVLEEVFEPADAAESRSLSLRVRSAYAAYFVSKSDLERIASSAAASLPAGFTPIGLPELSIASALAAEDGLFRLQVVVRRTLQASVDTRGIRGLVRGQRSGDALQELKRIVPSRRPPALRMFPSWWPWMPVTVLGLSVEAQ